MKILMALVLCMLLAGCTSENSDSTANPTELKAGLKCHVLTEADECFLVCRCFDCNTYHPGLAMAPMKKCPADTGK
jgi:hypothetical protein